MLAEQAEATVALTLDMPDRRTQTFHLAVASQRSACFALSVRKSGSSIFSSIVSAISHANNVPVVDIPGRSFENGYRYGDWNGHARIRRMLWSGNTYVGFRDPPTGFYSDPVFSQGRKILLVRDPRDALVSEYFSNAYSHSLPKVQAEGSVLAAERQRALNASIEEYVLDKVEALNRTVDGYRKLLGQKHLLVMRYEDVIFDKPEWCRQIAAHFGMEASDALVDAIVSWADVRPDVENAQAFVRRVTPGDHKEKLSAKTIGRIEDRLSDVWRDLGYGKA